MDVSRDILIFHSTRYVLALLSQGYDVQCIVVVRGLHACGILVRTTAYSKVLSTLHLRLAPDRKFKMSQIAAAAFCSRGKFTSVLSRFCSHCSQPKRLHEWHPAEKLATISPRRTIR